MAEYATKYVTKEELEKHRAEINKTVEEWSKSYRLSFIRAWLTDSKRNSIGAFKAIKKGLTKDEIGFYFHLLWSDLKDMWSYLTSFIKRLFKPLGTILMILFAPIILFIPTLRFSFRKLDRQMYFQIYESKEYRHIFVPRRKAKRGKDTPHPK